MARPTRREFLETLGRAYLMAPEGADSEVLLRYALASELDSGGEEKLLATVQGTGDPIEPCDDEELSCYDSEGFNA